MKTFRHILLLSLLLTAFACKKDKEAEPTKTDLLTAKTWKDQSQTLRLNTSEGTRPTAAADAYQFTRDGKVTITGANNASTTGTWAFANNESQLTITSSGTPSSSVLFELSANKLSFGRSYNQAQIQQGLSGNGGQEGQILQVLLLSAGAFTFPSGTPTIPTSQLTAVEWKVNAVPR